MPSKGWVFFARGAEAAPFVQQLKRPADDRQNIQFLGTDGEDDARSSQLPGAFLKRTLQYHAGPGERTSAADMITRYKPIWSGLDHQGGPFYGSGILPRPAAGDRDSPQQRPRLSRARPQPPRQRHVQRCWAVKYNNKAMSRASPLALQRRNRHGVVSRYGDVGTGDAAAFLSL